MVLKELTWPIFFNNIGLQELSVTISHVTYNALRTLCLKRSVRWSQIHSKSMLSLIFPCSYFLSYGLLSFHITSSDLNCRTDFSWGLQAQVKDGTLLPELALCPTSVKPGRRHLCCPQELKLWRNHGNTSRHLFPQMNIIIPTALYEE